MDSPLFDSSPAQWLSANFNLRDIGWFALLIGLWKGLVFLIRMVLSASEVHARLIRAEKSLDTMNDGLRLLNSNIASLYEETKGMRADQKARSIQEYPVVL